MKQKLVIELDMLDEKRRSKAMKIVVCAEGLISVALDEKDKRKFIVTGEGMDAYELVKSLKKHFWVKMESLEEVKNEKKEDEVKKTAENKPIEQCPCICQPTTAYYYRDPWFIF